MPRRLLLPAALTVLAWPVSAHAGGAAHPAIARVAPAARAALDARLLAAAQAGQAAQVAALLRAGADVNTADAAGRTALTWAVVGDHVAAARVLINAGADPDRQDAQRNNALLVTGETGSVAMLREVLRARPDVTRTNRFGGTALIPAADRGHLAYVRAVLATTGIDVNHVNNLGWTALLEAVILGDGGPTHTEIVRVLLAHGADPRIADRDGTMALEHARQRGYAGMVKLLQATD
ncbi:MULTISPECIES: ankyrin repeat domain-containing protein [Deinococcus]|uniref:Ankyrin repeat domain-containing protein n=1 Tax=Deinococcus rufus TaxID=2136097 RepID=A0ABV7ZAD8_9DEIO|nr:ankyrin repeat domain-containing protein [Deinococcus sp. AB2017081]WQE94925.1 ankyrin repeat domain-containing protein [Deinococcus sp. AB2017081]